MTLLGCEKHVSILNVLFLSHFEGSQSETNAREREGIHFVVVRLIQSSGLESCTKEYYSLLALKA